MDNKKQGSGMSTKDKIGGLFIFVWIFFGCIVGLQSLPAIIFCFILIPVVLCFDADVQKLLKRIFVLIGIGFYVIIEIPAVKSYITPHINIHKQYFGAKNYAKAFQNIISIFQTWNFSGVIQDFILPTIFFGLFLYAIFILTGWIIHKKSAEQKLNDDMQRRRPRYYKKVDFSAMRKIGYAVDAVPLGVELYRFSSFKRAAKHGIYMPADMLRQHVCVVGTTGSGKTVTLYNFILSALAHGKALVFVDGKGDPSNIAKFEQACRQYQRESVVITLDGGRGYNPFSSGSATELTDKLISMFDWSEEHYRLGATRFIQLLIRYMQLTDIGGGGGIFRDYAINTMRYALAVTFKLFVLQLLMGLGVQFLDTLKANTEFTMTDFCILTAVAIILFALVKSIPDVCAGIIQGSHVGSGAALGSAVRTIVMGGAGVGAAMYRRVSRGSDIRDAANMAGEPEPKPRS